MDNTRKKKFYMTACTIFYKKIINRYYKMYKENLTLDTKTKK